MHLLWRHALALVVALCAILATVGVFAFARPEYHPRYGSKTIDMSRQHIYRVADVRRVFAARGVRLRYSTQLGPKRSGITTLAAHFPWRQNDLTVSVAGPRAKVSWGVTFDRYDKRFGNVDVRYNGTDLRLLASVKAAVSDLR
jgi:hypothetical protein